MELTRIKSFKSKKGLALNDMYPAIVTLILVALILGIGIYVMVQVRRGIQANLPGFAPSQNISSGTTTLNGSLTSLYIDPNSVSVTWEDNTTALTNYTLREETGVFTWGGDIIDVDLVNITYTYNYDRENAEKGVTTAITGLDDFADWFAVIVVIIAAAIILGVIFKAFGRSAASSI